METECGGDVLRSLAPRWTLAGDEKLLEILQNTHKKIITKCQEVNAKLEEMSVALDDASISLQNVNNRFLALSNTQFIESRVYDDDADVTTQATPVKEPSPKPQSQESDLEMLKRSLMVLQDLHEPVTILKDSDTETDSDDDDGDRVVLRPKDLYSDRPLPYIIGSEAWKNSWHAGLIPEDSDAESGSEAREPPSPQYSDSEPEDLQESKANATISETSSELASEQETPAPVARATPADIAADLARRLGAPQPKVVEPAPEFSPAVPVSKTIYRPQQPQTAAIFADEPPPFDDAPSESSDDDIFAELHSNRPKNQTKVVEDLFGVTGVLTDYGAKVATQPRTEPRPQLFQEPLDEYEDTKPPAKRVEEEKSVSKKPVGGVSLFGNKGAESIGAAILKRNQRKSTSEEESDNEERTPLPKPKTVDQTDSVKTEKDIFEDLFAKSANLEEKKQKGVDKDPGTVKSAVKDKPVVDLFSDNLFDDVGDLFTSNVMKNNNKSNQKSIFDDDDDDLFADVAVPTVTKAKDETKNESIKASKGLFDSDDELFAEKSSAVAAKSIKKESDSNQGDKSESIVNNNNKPLVNTNNNVEKSVKPVTEVTKINNSESNIKTTKIKSIFDSDSDSDIFADLVKKKSKSDESESKDIFDNKASETSSLFKNVPEVKNNVLKTSDEIKNIRSPSLFDDDDDDLFSETPKIVKKENVPVKKSEEIDKEILNIGEEELFKVDNEVKPEILKTNHTQASNRQENEILVNVNQSEASNKLNVFDNDQVDNIFEENINKIIDSIPTEVKEGQNKQTETHEDLTPKLDTSMPNLDENKSSDLNTTLLQDTEHPISKDIFDDEPPIFEKPKEPKRSKNVNALFDDDSEDEALFFRKSDLEDKPENFPSTGQSDAVFGIFHDEPPAIDEFGDTTDIFNNVIPNRNIEEKLNSFQNVTNDNPEEPDNVPECVPEITASKVENKSIESDVNDFDDIFEGDKLDNAESDKKPINIHNTFSEIKENEFDVLFKSANKVVDDNDDIFKTTSIDAFIKSTESSSVIESNQASESVQDADLFDSKQPNNPETSAKSEIDFDSDEELFRMLPKPFKPTKVPENTSMDETDKDVKSDIFNEVVDRKSDELKSNKTEEVTVNKELYENVRSKHDSLKTFEDGAQTKPDLEGKRETESVESRNNDIKKVGRIKSLNLNIDVATLLPGASPKKNKTVNSPKERESESPSDSVSDEVKQTIPKVKSEAKVVKSISFDGEPNSAILDNKLSKERARIQVKRRPSTRKARREAVRKSAIDFDDSTDNSSSIDDPPKSLSEKSSSESPDKTTESKTADSDSSSLVVDGKSILNSSENVAKTIDIREESIKAYNTKTDAKVTSKVVYILNDEDIFDTRPETKSKDYDLFKKDVKPPIPTLGSVYKAGNIEKSVKNDTEFDKNANKSKASIFDSDSDEELFGGKSKRDDKKRVEVKGSLFGDDEDDELFGVKNKKADVSTKPQPSKTNPSKEIPTEPVFNDPLSMLGVDE